MKPEGIRTGSEQDNNPTEDKKDGVMWVIRDFAKRYRLDAKEEARLQKHHGPMASLDVLLSSARRY